MIVLSCPAADVIQINAHEEVHNTQTKGFVQRMSDADTALRAEGVMVIL